MAPCPPPPAWCTDVEANEIRKNRINKIDRARYEGKSEFVQNLAKEFNSSELSAGKYQSQMLYNRTDVVQFGEMLELCHPPAKEFIENCIKFSRDFHAGKGFFLVFTCASFYVFSLCTPYHHLSMPVLPVLTLSKSKLQPSLPSRRLQATKGRKGFLAFSIFC